jgi:uncharacterized protein YjiS (DUF1127 family)
MNTAQGAVRQDRTIRSTRSGFSFFERFWATFQNGRERVRLRADLCTLSDHELMDTGITRGKVDDLVSYRSIDPRGIQSGGGGIFFTAVLCTAFFLLVASEAGAQCTARDVLQNQLVRNKTPSVSVPKTLVRSAADVPVWKRITIGTFSDSLSLSNALNAVGCGIGHSAGKVLARPAFTVSAAKADVELFAVSAAELGFETDTASLADVYARAQQLGFGLAAAEIAPQLRLQYFDQPVGEFLIIGMSPIKTWDGEPVILTVANGGAGLILIGQDGSADAQISVVSRFLFVRPSLDFDWALL